MQINVLYSEYRTLDGSYKTLIKQVGDGRIIKRFDMTPYPENPDDIVCPHYLELKWAIGCPFNCAWCYLQGTLRLQPRKKAPTWKFTTSKVYDINRYDEIETHVKRLFRAPTTENEVLNTGELADSLMGEGFEQPFSKFIIPLFESQKRYKVLFLSKSDYIKNLLEIDSHQQTIMSFSLNSHKVAGQWERGAPSVDRRIYAAHTLSNHNYIVRIRIDPIVPWPRETWRDDYRELLDNIFSRFIPERITLGSLRGLSTTIRCAYDKSWVRFLTEPSKWGWRIAFTERREIFSELINYLERKYSYTNIALCKEPRQMWESLGLNWRECKCNCVW
ncbi:MAG: hypothetical protein QXH03_06190 [Candidatus Bathyarchaeia archaeon]